MEASLDKDWLSGEPRWWTPSDFLPHDFRPGELSPPASWVSSTPTSGNSGWIRQRLRPLAWGILRPMAWSPFFLISSVFPLAFPGRTPNDQLFAFAFFISSWLLVTLPLIFSRNAQPMSDPSIKSLPIDWLSIVIASIIFPFHIIVDPVIGWFSYAIFWIAYFRTVSLVQEAIISPPARFLLPIETSDWHGQLEGPWEVLSIDWARRDLAMLICDHGRLVIGGVSRGGHDFLALAFVHKSGFLHDPFHSSTVYCDTLSSTLANPPPIIGKEWPIRFLVVPEEE